MTEDNEKLIEEAQRVQQIDLTARLSPGDGLYSMSARGVQTLRDMIGRLSDALEAAEKAHTPTDDEREALREQFAYRVQTAVAYGKGVQKWGQLSQKTQDEWIDEQVALAMNSRAVSGFRLSEAPEPSAEDREVIAHVVKDVSVKWGGPSMAEFADKPPIRKHYAIADAIIVKGFHRDDDESIDAWHYVADHEAFKACHDEEQPLIDSVLARITQLQELESTVNELTPAPEPQGEPSDAQAEAAAREYHERGNGEGSFDRMADHVRTSLLFRMGCALRAAGVGGVR